MAPYREDRILRERVHDTYRADAKLREPAHCARCGLDYHNGRWQRLPQRPTGSVEHTCSACHRIIDNYPAGELTLSGSFVAAHTDELVQLARNTESLENEDHPLNRIISLESNGDAIRITTTDIHLPARIGKAVASAYAGTLDIHFDEGGHYARVVWRRES